MITYGLLLALKCITPGCDPLKALEDVVTSWHSKKLAGLPEPRREKFRSRQKTYSTRLGGPKVWEFVLEQPTDDHDGSWITEVRAIVLQTDTSRILCTVVMRTVPRTPTLAPLRYFVETPGFVRSLGSKFRVAIGDETPSTTSATVKTEDDVSEIVKFLQHPARSLPVVLVTGPVGPQTQPATELASHLASYLFPIAHVFDLTRDATFWLSQRVGQPLSCFDGATRIYWPGFSPSDAPRRHKLFWKQDIIASAQHSPEDPFKLLRINVMALIARASAATFQYPTQIAETISEAHAEDLAATIASLDIDAAKTKIEALEQELNYYKELSSDLEQRVRKAEARIEELEEEDSPDEVDTSWELKGIDLAIERSKNEFSTTLLFPNELPAKTRMEAGYWYNVLKSLHELCLLERKGLGRGRGEALREILMKNVRTPGKWKRGDTTVSATNPIDGTKVHLRDRVHLKEGKPEETESVYWEPLNEKENLVYLVGRLGTHA